MGSQVGKLGDRARAIAPRSGALSVRRLLVVLGVLCAVAVVPGVAQAAAPEVSLAVTTPGPYKPWTQVAFAASASDPDAGGGGTFSYVWTVDGVDEPATPSSALTRTFSAGAHTVSVKATAASVADEGPESASDATAITVAPNIAPFAAFTPLATNAVLGQPVTFNAGASGDLDNTPGGLTYIWTFGDGTNDSGVSPTHSWNTPGAKTITLTVNDGFDSSQRIDGSVYINTPPTPVATGPATATVGSQVGFSGLASTGNEPGEVLSFTWDFGDGTPVATGALPTHVYNLAGAFNVTMTVNDGSYSRSTVIPITVTNRPPIASLTASPTTVTLGDLIAVSASGSTDPDTGAGGLQYKFDTGSGYGAYSGAATTSTSYVLPGDKTIKVTVRDPQGAETEATVVVKVSLRRPPVPSFTFTPAAPQTGAIVKFTSTSQAGQTAISKYEWDLDGDGQFDDATGTTAQRSFTSPGRYTVSLRTTDSSPGTLVLAPSASATVVVSDAPSSGGTGTSNPNGTGVTAQSNTGNSTVAPGNIGQTAVTLGSLSKVAKVRISGSFKGSKARITRLTVTGPTGMKVRVVCKGKTKGCSKKQNTYKLQITSKKKSARFVRMRRTLRAGAVIEIYLTKSGSAGKYIKYRFRSGKPPARSISCLEAGSTKPTKCSSS